MMPSIQTRLAAAELRHWELEWRRHLLGCLGCTRARRRRRWRDLCAAGAATRACLADARAALRRERELDDRVPPGQGVLFPLDDDWCP